MGSHGLRSEPSSRRVWGQRPGQPYDIVMMKENISFHYGYFLLPVTIQVSLCSSTLKVVVGEHIDGSRSSNTVVVHGAVVH